MVAVITSGHYQWALGREARLRLSIAVGGHGTRARRGGGSQSQWAGNPSEARRWQLLTTLTHNSHLVKAPD